MRLGKSVKKKGTVSSLPINERPFKGNKRNREIVSFLSFTLSSLVFLPRNLMTSINSRS